MLVFSLLYQLSQQMTKTQILVIDDEEIILKSIKRILRNENYELLCAQDGLAGLELFEKNDPVVIVLDLMMPQMDGFETTRIIRELEAKQKTNTPIPIVAITAKAMKDDRQKCIDVGMNEFITKPILMKDLKEALLKFDL